MKINPPRNLPSPARQLQMRLLAAETDHVPVPAAPVGFIGTAQVDRLQDIGFSLGIIPVENIDPVGEGQLLIFVISEI